MDRSSNASGSTRKSSIAGGVAAVLLLILLFWLFAPRADSISVTRDRLAISAAQSGTFDDFLPVRGRVTPLVTVYLDAVEGGQVEQKLVEDGAQVTRASCLQSCPTPSSSSRRSRSRPRSSSSSTTCAARSWR